MTEEHTDSSTKDELKKRCEHVRDQLNLFLDKSYIYSAKEECFLPNDGTHEDDGIFGYLQECDILLMVNLKGFVYGARICVACGGPGIFIDTYRRRIEGYWGTEEVSIGLTEKICDLIDSAADEMKLW